jgi:hypothetical protein
VNIKYEEIAMQLSKRGVPTNTNKTIQLSVGESEKLYPLKKTRELLFNIQERAKKEGLLPKDYDILSKYKGRFVWPLGDISPASSKEMQPKGASEFEDRVKALRSSLDTGYIYELGAMIGSTHGGSNKVLLSAGDHRHAAMSRSDNYTHALIDLVQLDIDNNPDDRMMHDLISTNSNNHPPQWAMTNKELIAFLYRTIKREDNKHLFDMFNVNVFGYSKKRCHKLIKVYKDTITDSSLKTVLTGLHQKMEENSDVLGMYKNYKNEQSIEQSNTLLGINGDDIKDVELSMIHRYLFNEMLNSANTNKKTRNIVLTNTTSDFEISLDKLNKKRASLFNTDSFYSAQSTVDGFRTLDIPKKNIELVKILGWRAQHSSEDVSNLIRVDDKQQSTSVTYQEALKLSSLVI